MEDTTKKKSEGLEKVMESMGNLKSLREEIENVVPNDRNFAVMQITSIGKSCVLSLFLKKDGCERINLESFLPKKYKFKRGEEYACDSLCKEIIYPSSRLEQRGGVLNLFHEIGHSHIKEKLNDGVDLMAATIYALWKKFTNSAPKKNPLSYYLPCWFIEKMHKGIAKSERASWAFAVRKLRKLENEGYNVFAGFRNGQEIKIHILSCLCSYEVARKIDLFNAGKKIDLKKVKSPYLRGNLTPYKF